MICIGNGIESEMSLNRNVNVNEGDVVLVAGHKLAIVRYKGQVDFASGTWIGVELKGHRDEAQGHDGSVHGTSYFKTKHDKAGLFVQKVIRRIPPEELLQKVAELNEKLLLCTCGGSGDMGMNGHQDNKGGDLDPNSSSDEE